MSEDKRVRRTKKLLRQALAELMQEKEFKNITVTDVVRRADINRGTFYTYYQDVFDLREKVENEMVDTLRALVDRSLLGGETGTMRSVLEQAVKYLEENRALTYALLSDRSLGSFEDKLMTLMEACSQKILPPKNRGDLVPIWFAAAGCIGVIKKWMIQDEAISKDVAIAQIDAILCGILHMAGARPGL